MGEPIPGSLVRLPTRSYDAEPVARLTLDSPHNRNALSSALVEQMHDGLSPGASAEHGVRMVVLGHTGGTFCAGADLSEAADAAATRPRWPPSGRAS